MTPQEDVEALRHTEAETVRYYLNIVAEEDAHIEAIAALDALVARLEQTERENRVLTFAAENRWQRMEDAEARVEELQRERDGYQRQSSDQADEAIKWRKQVGVLEAALRFYAEHRNYRWAAGHDFAADHDDIYCPMIQNDSWLGGQPGSRARAALDGETA